MARLARTTTVDDAGLVELREPRMDLVQERLVGVDRFEATAGPVTRYRRDLQVVSSFGGRHRVEEVTDFALAVGPFRFLLTLPFKRALSTRHGAGIQPWWAPPVMFDARGADSLSQLAVLAMVTGYLGTLLSQSITFAAEEFGASDGAQGATLAAVRIGVLIALVISALADRVGRQRVIRLALIASALVSATTALAPGLIAFGVSQTVARGFSASAGLILAIIAAEEVPAGARAWTAGILSLCAGLGSGMVIWILPVTALDVRAWRILYLVPLLWLPVIIASTRRLPESKRFNVVSSTPRPSLDQYRGTLALLAISAFFGLLFFAPASQFLNEFLRDERGFSGFKLSAFALLVNTPVGVGVFFGGRLADRFGRRVVGATAVVVGIGLTVLVFQSSGWLLWVPMSLGAVIRAAAIPALGVYGPELFPTALRGRANGVITVVGVVGSSSGLLIAGVLSDRWGSLSPALAVLAIGPLVLAALVLAAYPETKGKELEELS